MLIWQYHAMIKKKVNTQWLWVNRPILVEEGTTGRSLLVDLLARLGEWHPRERRRQCFRIHLAPCSLQIVILPRLSIWRLKLTMQRSIHVDNITINIGDLKLYYCIAVNLILYDLNLHRWQNFPNFTIVFLIDLRSQITGKWVYKEKYWFFSIIFIFKPLIKQLDKFFYSA